MAVYTGSQGSTHIRKLGYYVLTLVMSVKAVPRPEILGRSYRLVISQGLGAGVQPEGSRLLRWVFASGAQQRGRPGDFRPLFDAICTIRLVVIAGGARRAFVTAGGVATRQAVFCLRARRTRLGLRLGSAGG